MPSFRFTVLAVAAAFVTVASGDKWIEPDSVSEDKRVWWCDSQKRTCPMICQQVEPRTTLVNECNPDDLTYGCLCGNNLKPNVSEYTQSLPFYVCQEWGVQCVKNCNANTACQADCLQLPENQCGAQDPSPPNKTKTSDPAETSSSSTKDDADVIQSTSPGGEDNGNAATALAIGRSYGLAIVFGTMFAGFAML